MQEKFPYIVRIFIIFSQGPKLHLLTSVEKQTLRSYNDDSWASLQISVLNLSDLLGSAVYYLCISIWKC